MSICCPVALDSNSKRAGGHRFVRTFVELLCDFRDKGTVLPLSAVASLFWHKRLKWLFREAGKVWQKKQKMRNKKAKLEHEEPCRKSVCLMNRGCCPMDSNQACSSSSTQFFILSTKFRPQLEGEQD